MEIPRHWRLKGQRYRLQGSVCPICGEPLFPPRPICPRCIGQPVDIAAMGLAATDPVSGIAVPLTQLRRQATESTTR